MKISEIKELSVKEIEERIDATKSELVRMELNHSISPLDNPMKIRATRRIIARLNTVLRQKQLTGK